MVRIIAFSGSGRKESLNQKLVQIAAQGAENAGAQVTVLNLKELELPIYDGDLEASEGLPEGAIRFKQLLADHQGFLIASPEYNSSLSPLLKNAIDWASRPSDGEAPLAAFDGKVAGLMAASPGGLGGLRGLVHLRAILQNIKVMVIPDQMAIAKAFEAFDEQGALTDPKQDAIIKGIGKQVAEIVGKLNA